MSHPTAFLHGQVLPRPSLPAQRCVAHRLKHHQRPTLRAQTGSQMPRRAALKLLALSAAAPLPALSGVRVADVDAGSKVVTTASGLSYYDFITPGADAAEVQPGSRVSVHYTLGTTGARNGWRIDSSYDREPLSFTVGAGEVVRGLDEGVLGMRSGGRRRVVIPAALGYRTKDDRPVVMGFAEWQRFKNIYLNPDRQYKPDLVMDVSVVRVTSGSFR